MIRCIFLPKLAWTHLLTAVVGIAIASLAILSLLRTHGDYGNDILWDARYNRRLTTTDITDFKNSRVSVDSSKLSFKSRRRNRRSVSNSADNNNKSRTSSDNRANTTSSATARTRARSYSSRRGSSYRLSNETLKQLSRIASSRSPDMAVPVVLTAAEWSYRTAIFNWIKHAEILKLPYVVLCYDAKIYKYIGSDRAVLLEAVGNVTYTSVSSKIVFMSGRTRITATSTRSGVYEEERGRSSESRRQYYDTREGSSGVDDDGVAGKEEDEESRSTPTAGRVAGGRGRGGGGGRRATKKSGFSDLELSRIADKNNQRENNILDNDDYDDVDANSRSSRRLSIEEERKSKSRYYSRVVPKDNDHNVDREVENKSSPPLQGRRTRNSGTVSNMSPKRRKKKEKKHKDKDNDATAAAVGARRRYKGYKSRFRDSIMNASKTIVAAGGGGQQYRDHRSAYSNNDNHHRNRANSHDTNSRGGAVGRIRRMSNYTVINETTQNFDAMMLAKHHAVNHLLITQNRTVVWSDSDAIWLKPCAWSYFMNAPGDIDIIAQRGLSPYKIADTTGAVVCAGFFMVRPTQRSKILFSKVLNTVAFMRDDQKTLNEYIYKFNGFDFGDHKKLEYSNSEYTIDVTNGTEARTITVGLLPYKEFPRGIAITHKGKYKQKHGNSTSKTKKSNRRKKLLRRKEDTHRGTAIERIRSYFMGQDTVEGGGYNPHRRSRRGDRRRAPVKIPAKAHIFSPSNNVATYFMNALGGAFGAEQERQHRDVAADIVAADTRGTSRRYAGGNEDNSLEEEEGEDLLLPTGSGKNKKRRTRKKYKSSSPSIDDDDAVAATSIIPNKEKNKKRRSDSSSSLLAAEDEMRSSFARQRQSQRRRPSSRRGGRTNKEDNNNDEEKDEKTKNNVVAANRNYQREEEDDRRTLSSLNSLMEEEEEGEGETVSEESGITDKPKNQSNRPDPLEVEWKLLSQRACIWHRLAAKSGSSKAVSLKRDGVMLVYDGWLNSTVGDNVTVSEVQLFLYGKVITDD